MKNNVEMRSTVPYLSRMTRCLFLSPCLPQPTASLEIAIPPSPKF